MTTLEAIPLLVRDLDETTYHADPSLSASGAKKLLPPSCPALFHYERTHGQPSRPAFDFGRAAHALVLGVGAPIVKVPCDDWRSKAAKEARDAAYADGNTPVLESEWERIVGMADALHAHPIAGPLLDPAHGEPEVSAFWPDRRHGVARRARFDWLPHTDGGRLLLTDYKTAQSASPAAFTRAVFDYGYALQAAWYLDAVKACELADDAAFLFVVQEKTPPYLVTVVELDGDALRIGAEQADRALATFAECTATGVWPGYSDDVELISPPPWVARQYGSVL